MAKQPKCDECGSADTKKASQVSDEGTSRTSGLGIGIGTGGIGLGGGNATSRSELAKKASYDRSDDTHFGNLVGFIKFVRILGLYPISAFIGVLLGSGAHYELVHGQYLESEIATIAGWALGILVFVLLAYLVHRSANYERHLAAAIYLIIPTVTTGGLIYVVIGDYSVWWMALWIALIALFGLGWLAVAWEAIQDYFHESDEERRDREKKDYEKTWICLTCGNRWVNR